MLKIIICDNKLLLKINYANEHPAEFPTVPGKQALSKLSFIWAAPQGKLLTFDAGTPNLLNNTEVGVLGSPYKQLIVPSLVEPVLFHPALANCAPGAYLPETLQLELVCPMVTGHMLVGKLAPKFSLGLRESITATTIRSTIINPAESERITFGFINLKKN